MNEMEQQQTFSVSSLWLHYSGGIGYLFTVKLLKKTCPCKWIKI